MKPLRHYNKCKSKFSCLIFFGNYICKRYGSYIVALSKLCRLNNSILLSTICIIGDVLAFDEEVNGETGMYALSYFSLETYSYRIRDLYRNMFSINLGHFNSFFLL